MNFCFLIPLLIITPTRTAHCTWLEPFAHIKQKKEELFDAVVNKDIQRVESILQQHPGLLNATNEGRGLLHLAAFRDDKAMVKTLLSKKAKIDLKDYFHETPLHNACRCNHINIVKLLVESGADLEAQDQLYGWTPLHIAIDLSYEKMIDFLVRAGANIYAIDKKNKTPFSKATPKIKRIITLIFTCKKISQVISANRKLVEGSTLHQAVLMKVKGFANKTILHEAVLQKEPDVIKLLLEQGAELEDKDLSLNTPLNLAVREKNDDSIEMLVAYGAHVDQSDKEYINECISSRIEAFLSKKIISPSLNTKDQKTESFLPVQDFSSSQKNSTCRMS